MLEIRPITANDADALLEFMGDPAVARWLRPAGQEGPFTHSECEATVARKVAHWTAHGFGTSLGFRDQRCVGWSHLQHCRAGGRSEVDIGWAVVSDLWGLGIGTALGEHALASARDLGLERIVAFTLPENGASRRVMEKLALRYERDITYAGRPHVLYATP
jgi:RimJ/RimL family protein N-acetyltransferase